MHELAARIEEAAAEIRRHWAGRPRVGIILGTGLGSLAQEIATEAAIDYAAIPHFPRATAVGHAGQLVCGKLLGMPVLAMEGRFHVYEGYTYQQVTFPGPRDEGPRGGIARRFQRLRRHESALQGRRHRGHRGPHQPDDRQSARSGPTTSRSGRDSPTCPPRTIGC